MYRASVSSSDTFNISLPSHFEITSTINKTSTTNAYCYYETDNDYDIGSLRQNGSISVRHGSGSPFVDKNSSIIKYNEPTTLSYEYDNGTHTISANNQSASGTNSTSIGNFIRIHIEQYTVTDLKIKPL